MKTNSDSEAFAARDGRQRKAAGLIYPGHNSHAPRICVTAGLSSFAEPALKQLMQADVKWGEKDGHSKVCPQQVEDFIYHGQCRGARVNPGAVTMQAVPAVLEAQGA